MNLDFHLNTNAYTSFANNNVDHSIAIYNAASPDKSLGIMLWFVAVEIPLLIGYTYLVHMAF